MGTRLLRVRRFFLGDRPRALLVLLTPTLLALALDLVLRIGTILSFRIAAKGIYFSSILISAAFWALPLVLVARLFRSKKVGARIARVSFFALWVLPIATFAYGGQALYFRVFRVYIGRDTVRLGIALRGTVGGWFNAWGGPLVFVAIFSMGMLITLGIHFRIRRAAQSLPKTVPWLLVATFGGALFCFWTDNVDSRFLQAALPDVCFVHSAIHALKTRVTGKWNERQGMSIRTPAALPPLVSSREHGPSGKPNVIVILTESVRSDAICSDPTQCKDAMLDPVVPDRVPLGKLESQTPNTFSACMVLWSGLTPATDFKSAHTAPLLWEVAHAVGYRTAYITSQNPDFEDFGAYVRNAGIDTLVTATDLGGMAQEQLGAPDERVTSRMLDILRAKGDAPIFALMQFSNTHAPYRTDASVMPYLPESENPIAGVDAFHNHYLNAVRFQEQTLAAFLTALRAMPMWDDTVVIFLSDHGEEFRDHGGLYHNHSLWEEQLRIPGWLVSGKNVLNDDERAALAAYRKKRTYSQDVHATVIDLLGVHDAEATLPIANLVGGRSLLRKPPAGEAIALLATSTSVWQPDDARFGVRVGERVTVGWGPNNWICYNTQDDPDERLTLPAVRCRDLQQIVNSNFGPNMHALGWR